MPEELRFDELLRDRGAVDLDERGIRAGRQPVDRPGNQLLARPVLPRDEDARIGRCDPRDFVLEAPEGGRYAEESGLRLREASERLDLRDQVAPFDSLLGGQQHAFERQRLFEEIVGSQPDRPHGRFDVRVPGDHDDGKPCEPFARRLEDRKAVAVAQPYVEEDEVPVLLREAAQALLARFARASRRSLRRTGSRRASRGLPVRRR